MKLSCTSSALVRWRLYQALTLLACSATLSSLHAATFLWDGGGANNNWTTANNWDPNGAPGRTSGHDLVFAGTTRLSPNTNGGEWTINSLTFNSSSGAFSLSGNGLNIGAGGITNNSTSSQTIANQITLSANQTWDAASGAITTSNYINANSKDLTLGGSGAITTNGQLNNVATLSLTGGGDRTFGTNQVSATTVNISSTGTNSFGAQLSVGTLNVSAGINNFANVQAGTGINVSGSADANFTGPVTGGSSGVNISSSGDIVFSGTINSGSITLNGSGTTTITGSGSMSTGAVTVNSGTLIMDHDGTAINSSLTVNDGGTVVFSQDNQVPSWQTITLNEGGTLDLNDTSQTIANLIITGDSIIDFGTGGSQLNVQTWGEIDITDNITITLKNWNDAVDVFSGSNPGDVVVNIEYADNDGNVYAYGTWVDGYIVPAAPVPEPATYGLLLVGGITGLLLTRRRPHRPTSRPRGPLSLIK